jgi:hypothetical protein
MGIYNKLMWEQAIGLCGDNKIFLTWVRVVIMAAQQSSTRAEVDTLPNSDSEDNFLIHDQSDACSNNASDSGRDSGGESNSGASDDDK